MYVSTNARHLSLSQWSLSVFNTKMRLGESAINVFKSKYYFFYLNVGLVKDENSVTKVWLQVKAQFQSRLQYFLPSSCDVSSTISLSGKPNTDRIMNDWFTILSTSSHNNWYLAKNLWTECKKIGLKLEVLLSTVKWYLMRSKQPP